MRRTAVQSAMLLFTAAAAHWHPAAPARVHEKISYAAANAALGDPKPGEARVVFIGDSITLGWVVSDPGFFHDPARIGRGIPSETAGQIADRFAADALALKPKVVHILAGASDLAENAGPVAPEAIVAAVADMAARARAAGAGVVIGSILPALDYPWHRGLEPAPKIVALNTLLRRLATENHYVYADYYAALATPAGGLPAGLSKDGVHPNAAGYRRIDPVAETAIAAAMPH